MKKFLKILSIGVLVFSAMFLVGFAGKNVAYATSESSEPIQQETIVDEDKMFLESIITGLFTGAGGVGVALLAYIPIILKVKKAKDTVEALAKTVANLATENNNTKSKLDETVKELKRYKLMFEETNKAAVNVEKIVKIGFCNMSELVSNGYAREIAKIGEENDETKE